MKGILKKALSLMLSICLVMGMLPATTALAADVEQIKVALTTTPVSVYRDENVKVNLDVTGVPYTGKVEPNDVVLVVDVSGSMGNSMEDMKVAMKRFVSTIDLNTHRVGIIGYDTDVQYRKELTNDKNVLLDYIDTINVMGGTLIHNGINGAVSLLAQKRVDAYGSIVLMTDGMSNDFYRGGREKCLAAAASAKASGYFFYTVALCKSETSEENLALQEMATSKADHYSLFYSSGLSKVYNNIAKKIGNCNAKDVVIKQKLSDNVEFVTGSADNNVPVPTYDKLQNTLTWKMNQLVQGTVKLGYEVKIKHNSPAGEGVASTGTITYLDYNDTTQTIAIPNARIIVKYHAPEIDSITGTLTNLGGDTIMINGKYFENTSKLYINGNEVAPLTIRDTSICFNMPEGQKEKSVIKVVNPDGQYVTYGITVEQTPVIKSVTPDHGVVNSGTQIAIEGHGFLGTPLTIEVLVGTEPAYVEGIWQNKIVCRVPTTPAIGTYDIKVTNPNGNSGSLANAYTYEPRFVPANAEMIKAVAGDSCVELVWNPVAEATKYMVYVFDKATGAQVKTMAITNANTYAKVLGLTNGKEYGFGVKTYARNTWGDVPDTSNLIYATPVAPPAPPVQGAEITALEPGNGQVTVTWTPVEKATKYRIYAYKNGQRSGARTMVVTTAGQYTATIKSLSNNVEYGFWVESYSSVTRKWSGQPAMADLTWFATPSKTPTPAPACAVITKAVGGDTSIDVEWSPVDNAKKYKVYYYLNGSLVSYRVVTSGTSCTITGLSKGKEYGLSVVSCVNNKWGTPDTAHLTMCSTTAVPQNNSVAANISSAVAGNKQVELTWNAVNGATKYRVYVFASGASVKNQVVTSGTSCVISGLSNGTEYSFSVQSCVANKWGNVPKAADATVKATPVDSSLVVPTTQFAEITGSTSTANSITLIWTPIEKATKYKVFVFNETGSLARYSVITTLNASGYAVNTATINSLYSGKKYYCAVQYFTNGKWYDAPAFADATYSVTTT